MSRSNTNYYNLCHWWKEIGEDGYCDHHRGWKGKCIPPGEYETRRGMVVRKPRFPAGWTWKSYSSGPPRDVKQIWQGIIRARHRAAIALNPDDPELFDSERWLAGQYSWWS